MATLLTLDPVQNTPEVRPLSSTGITRFPRYYRPVRHPPRPGLSLAGVRLGDDLPPPGLPVLRSISVYKHAVALTPVGPQAGSFRSPFACDSGLPHPLAGSAPTLDFSRPARRSRKLRPVCSRDRQAVLCIEGSDDVVTSIAAPIATGWSESCRVGIAPTEDRRLCTAHKGTQLFILMKQPGILEDTIILRTTELGRMP
jgi:hypothetical protein